MSEPLSRAQEIMSSVLYIVYCKVVGTHVFGECSLDGDSQPAQSFIIFSPQAINLYNGGMHSKTDQRICKGRQHGGLAGSRSAGDNSKFQINSSTVSPRRIVSLSIIIFSSNSASLLHISRSPSDLSMIFTIPPFSMTIRFSVRRASTGS